LPFFSLLPPSNSSSPPVPWKEKKRDLLVQDSICCCRLAAQRFAPFLARLAWWFIGVARLSFSWLLQFLIQARIAGVDGCPEAEIAARRVIPWSLLVAVASFDPFLWEILVDVLGFLGAQFPNSPF